MRTYHILVVYTASEAICSGIRLLPCMLGGHYRQQQPHVSQSWEQQPSSTYSYRVTPEAGSYQKLQYKALKIGQDLVNTKMAGIEEFCY